MSKKIKSTTKKSASADANINTRDLFAIIDAEVRRRGLIGHHLHSFNRFASEGANQIVTQLFEIKQTIQNIRTKTTEDNAISYINFVVRFTDVKIGKPVARIRSASNEIGILLPNMARKHNLNYSAPITVSANITAKAYLKSGGAPLVRSEDVQDFQIATMPVMVGSACCHLSGMTREEKRACEEDPNDPGGYFILKEGTEWVISASESRLFNYPHTFHNIGHDKEIARLEFISQAGDNYENSSELIMRLVTNGNIYLTFTSNVYLKVLNIPFYVIFRLFGMNTDKEIVDNVVYGYSYADYLPEKDLVSDHMLQVLKRALRASDADFADMRDVIDQVTLLESFSRLASMQYQTKIATPGFSQVDESRIKHLNSHLLGILDNLMFPHLGMTAQSRHKKLRFMGHLIHRMLLVEMGVAESTDRDSLRNKRINAAGMAYMKVFKAQFNIAIVRAVRARLKKDFVLGSFSQVQLAQSFKTAVRSLDLEKALIQAIVSGSKDITIKNRQVPNRLSSEQLHVKNQLNVLSSLCTVRTPTSSASKQAERSDQMRRVHPSYCGYICPGQSADNGMGLGTVKQKTLVASITESSSSLLLKNLLLADPLVLPLEKVFPEQIHRYHLTKILVNGDWIGCCFNAPWLVAKYRETRRGYRVRATLKHQPDQPLIGFADGSYEFIGSMSPGDSVNPFTSIFWDVSHNEILFWVDAGRFVRPMIIVRNNGELDPIGREHFGSSYDPFRDPPEPEDGCFVQDMLLTAEHLQRLKSGELEIMDLVEAGILEFISPDELENCFVAVDLDALRSNKHNALRPYTHCEIPQGNFGLPILTTPFSAHNQVLRNVYQSNQAKQTCGPYILSWPFRVNDKHAFLQYYCEVPLIQTLANRYLYPNGRNTVVAIASYTGYNMEDSLIFNRSAAERGEYRGLAFNATKIELEKGERFAIPDANTVLIEKKHANYGKLRGRGFVTKNEKLEKNDVMVGRITELAKPLDGRNYRDVSVVYQSNEPAMVEAVVHSRNQEDIEFVKVKYSSVRTLGIGDKFSSRAGQKGVTGMGYHQWDMLFTGDGIVPSLIVNPHAIPSRMTIGQLIEGLAGKISAVRGSFSDASIFQPADIYAMGDALEDLGYDRFGNEFCYDGRTGEPIDGEIFIGPTYYQRLQKFVADEVYSIPSGPTSVLTRQPLEGKSNKGGLRLGEMERDVMLSHGAARLISEKFRDDSDGFDVYVCRNCGKFAVVNEEQNIFICNTCRSARTSDDIYRVRSTWASKLFLQELESSNVGFRMSIAPYEYAIE